MKPTAAAALKRLRALGNPKDARILQGFFKTGPGDYGAGDRFLGVRVPATRALAREMRDMPLDQIELLLHSRWHEARLLALILLGTAYVRGSTGEREAIFRLYLRNSAWVNSWDLVDLSAPNIVGAHLDTRTRGRLDALAKSKHLWERRIAIVATHYFIRHGDFNDALRITRTLMRDPHDLIHKAAGWMLREVGKRDRRRLEAFLDVHAHEMPRIMLRYSIERLPEPARRRYMGARQALSAR